MSLIGLIGSAARRRSDSFDPLSITGLLAWWDASDATTLYDATSGGSLVAADGAVARWEDKSGNGYHATDADSSRRPLRRTSIVNGLDVLDFDGENDRLQHTVSATTATIFAVYKLNSVKTGYRGIVSTNASLMLAEMGGSSKWGSFGGSNIPAASDANTAWGVKTLVDPNNGTCAFYSDGATDGTGAQNPIGQSPQHIGGEAAQQSHAYIAEVLIYDSALDGGDLAAVHAYLTAKWL
jgi:hypothetical protein